MKPFIQLSLPTGELYELPVQVIADSRAAYYHKERPEEFPTLEAAMEDTVALFSDSYQVQDWAMGNMNPPDYMPHARLVRFTPPGLDLQAAEWSFHDAAAMIPQLDEASVLRMPVEMALAAMAAHNRVCQFAALNDDKGQPQAAIILVQGGPGVVGYYQGLLEVATTKLLTPPESATTADATADAHAGNPTTH